MNTSDRSAQAVMPMPDAAPNAMPSRRAMRLETYLSIVRVSALYDLLVTWPFVTPWTLAFVLGLINGFHTRLGLPGDVPAFGPTHLLFGGLMGSVVVVWSMARLRLNLPTLGRYDAAARFLFAGWQVLAVAIGATPLILIFTAFEVVFGILQILPHRTEPRNLARARRSRATASRTWRCVHG